MKPYVHGRRIIFIPRIVKLLRQLLPSRKTAIHPDKFQQIDDRFFPVELFRVLGPQSVED